MNAQTVTHLLNNFLNAIVNGETDQTIDALIAEAEITIGAIGRVRSFAEAGVLTSNAGLEVELTAPDEDGELEASTFQITVVQSR